MWLFTLELIDWNSDISWEIASFRSSGQVCICLYLEWSILARAALQKRYNTSSICSGIHIRKRLFNNDLFLNELRNFAEGRYTAAHNSMTRFLASSFAATGSQNSIHSLCLPARSLFSDSGIPTVSIERDLSSRKALQCLCQSTWNSQYFSLLWWPSHLE